MSEISSLGSLEGEHITETQLLAMIAKCDLALHNILFSNGTWGAVDFQEFGPAGHKTEPSKLVQMILKTKEHYLDMLNNPEKRGDYAILISQFDDPAL